MSSINAWVINKGNTDIDVICIELKKQIIFKSNIPMQLPINIAMNYVQKFTNIQFCKDPEKYFLTRNMKQLIIRDAGIGDLLLLEPVIRELKNNKNIDITMLSMFPDVYNNNPSINKNLLMNTKENIKNINFNDYDCYEDLRNYSETAGSRHEKHRTDVYNEKFNLEIKDKEPRIYFKNEKSILNKKEGYIYIGIELNASHSYRKYYYGTELIEYILNADKRNVIVILGKEDFISYNENKRIINYQSKTTIRECINIIKDIDYMITVDSGLMHVALSLHIPTVCIFSIITPKLRLQYYTGNYKVIWESPECHGCGDYHMMRCKHGDIKKDFEIPKCLDIKPEKIYKLLYEMPIEKEKKIYNSDDKNIKKEFAKPILKINKKLTMPIVVYNEEKNLPRFIELVINNPYIGKVIAIDGGSTDKTVELFEKAGVFVYVHNYDKNYHDMQAMQRNYSCSFVKDDTNIIIMDIDECFSKDLEEYLPVLAENTSIEYGIISRKTFNYYSDINDPLKQIKNYPDWQPRFFKWNRRFKWVGSPHHNIYNCPVPFKIQKDILHFEKEGKDREALELRWSEMHKKTKQVYV